MQLRNTAGKVSCYEEIQLLTFKVIISACFNDGKLRRKINIVIHVYSLKSLNVKKKYQVCTSIHIVVGKAFYIKGLIYERKLIGSVTHCSEFKMLMKSTPCTCK